MLLVHFFRLLGRSFDHIPAALGSNWLGLVSPVLIALIGEGIGIWAFGWQAMKDNWKKATGIGLAAIGAFYTVVFLGCVFTTTYQDHKQLASRVGTLRQEVDSSKQEREADVRSAQQPLILQLGELKQSCAETKGANDVLQRQNRDQQGTINGCLTQAMKLIAVPPFALDLKLAKVGLTGVAGKHTDGAFIVVSTNRTVAAFATISCSQDFKVEAWGTTLDTHLSMWDGSPRKDKRSFPIQRTSPAWNPGEEFVYLVTYVADAQNTFNCSVHQ